MEGEREGELGEGGARGGPGSLVRRVRPARRGWSEGTEPRDQRGLPGAGPGTPPAAAAASEGNTGF